MVIAVCFFCWDCEKDEDDDVPVDGRGVWTRSPRRQAFAQITTRPRRTMLGRPWRRARREILLPVSCGRMLDIGNERRVCLEWVGGVEHERDREAQCLCFAVFDMLMKLFSSASEEDCEKYFSTLGS